MKENFMNYSIISHPEIWQFMELSYPELA